MRRSNLLGRQNPGGGGIPYRNDAGCSSYLLGVKNAVLVPFRVFSFKTSSVLAFVVHLREEIR